MKWRYLLLGAGFTALVGVGAYQLPFVQESVGWRVEQLRASIYYAVNPPQQAVFTPDPTLSAMVNATLSALSTPTPSQTATAVPDHTEVPSAVPTPIPASAELTGFRHEYQSWNNCGPATLAMALSFWGWEGDQRPVASFTKPNWEDKNVFPYELEAFVEQKTDLRMIVRVAGDLETLKRFIAAGFPVVIEKGFETASVEGWMGHYQLLAGYDDDRSRFNAYDSFEGDFSDGKTLPVAYSTVEQFWPHFNYTYMVLYPPAREAEVYDLIGPDLDETDNIERAAQRASEDIYRTTGRDQFFAWYNRGTNLRLLQDYGGAAAAYDQAFEIYAELLPEDRPRRALWYETGPYWAYYYTGRYWDVINLATFTLYETMPKPVLEESFYWRGLAKEALGDVAGAIADFRTSVELHPGFEPGLAQLERLGVAP